MRILEILAVLLGGGLLGALGLYIGLRLARYRRHRSDEEIQTMLSRNRLD
jgi:hypothetical protein